MSFFTNPEIKKRWESVLKRKPVTLPEGAIILRQGEKFHHCYLIVQGTAQIYRELSFKKLQLNSHVDSLGPFDIISLNQNQESKYTIKVKNIFLRYIKLEDHQKQIVSTKSINQWRNNKADTLQRKFNNKIFSKRNKQKQRKPLLKFIQNQPIIIKQLTHKSVIKLPVLPIATKNNGSISSRSTTSMMKDRKTPMYQDSDRFFGSVLRQYLSKRVDYQSNNIPLTICSSMQVHHKQNKQNI